MVFQYGVRMCCVRACVRACVRGGAGRCPRVSWWCFRTTGGAPRPRRALPARRRHHAAPPPPRAPLQIIHGDLSSANILLKRIPGRAGASHLLAAAGAVPPYLAPGAGRFAAGSHMAMPWRPPVVAKVRCAEQDPSLNLKIESKSELPKHAGCCRFVRIVCVRVCRGGRGGHSGGGGGEESQPVDRTGGRCTPSTPAPVLMQSVAPSRAWSVLALPSMLLAASAACMRMQGWCSCAPGRAVQPCPSRLFVCAL